MVWIAGCDEVGRGALAGPLVAAAVLVREHQRRPSWLPARRDSKMFSLAQRQRLAERACAAFSWSVAWVEAAEIDGRGLQAANHAAVRRAVALLPIRPAELLVDYVAGFTHAVPTQLIRHGDRSRWPIALASIIAKVQRDHLMGQLHRQWLAYGFNRNAGYGTARHSRAIGRHGLSPLHRRSFSM